MPCTKAPQRQGLVHIDETLCCTENHQACFDTSVLRVEPQVNISRSLNASSRVVALLGDNKKWDIPCL